MKLIKISDELHAALLVYGKQHHRTIGAQVAAMLEADAGLTEVNESLQRKTVQGTAPSVLPVFGSLRDLKRP